MRRPMVGLALDAVAGVLLAFSRPAPLPLLLPALVTLPALWGLSRAVLRHRPGPRGRVAATCETLFIHLAAVLLFWAHADLSLRPLDSRHILNRVQAPRETLEMRGIIAQPPEIQEGEWYTRVRFPVELTAIQRLEKRQPATGRVEVEWRGRTPGGQAALRYGDEIEATGILRMPTTWRYRPSFSILDNDLEVTGTGQGNPLYRALWDARAVGKRILSTGIAEERAVLSVLQALMLGYRDALDSEQWGLFAETGMLHIFAISGLHVGVMAALLIFVFRSLGIRRPRWGLFLIPLLGCYVIITGLQVSALRAWLMVSVYWAGLCIGRKPDVPSALSAAAILMLSADPRQLVQPGFLLSFTIVAGLWLLTPPFLRPLREWARGDPFKAEPDPLPARVARKAVRHIGDIAVVSLVAWLVSMPLATHFFHRVAWLAPLANLVVVPMAFLVVCAGCLSLLTGWAIPVLADLFNHANWALLSALLGWVEWIHQLPGSWRSVAGPSLSAMAGAYAVLFGWRFPKPRLRRLVVAGGVIVLLTAAGTRLQSGGGTVVVYDAGRGQATLIDAPGGRHVLIGSGSSYSARRIARDLRRRGINRLDAVILTHAASGAYGGLAAIREGVAVGEVWISPDPGRSSRYRDLLNELKEEGVSLRTVVRGDTGRWGSDVRWEVLHPGRRPRARRASEGSLVLRFAFGPVSFLHMGGGGSRAEHAVLGKTTEVAADFLIAGRTMERRALSTEWLYAVWPAHVILSTESRSRGGDPAPSLLARLDAVRAGVWMTSRDGDVEIHIPEGADTLSDVTMTTRW